jgi:hypothetical protein
MPTSNGSRFPRSLQQRPPSPRRRPPPLHAALQRVISNRAGRSLRGPQQAQREPRRFGGHSIARSGSRARRSGELWNVASPRNQSSVTVLGCSLIKAARAWTVGCTVARSHGTRAPASRANRMSRVRVARSRVRLMVRLYIAHVGVDPPGVTAAGRRCGLDGGLHRGSFAWYPGPSLTRKPHEPCSCSPLSGQTYHDGACT